MRMTAFAVASLMAAALMFSVMSWTATAESKEEPAYEVHAPILIDGDDEFTSENGVTGGSGALGDPFIIEGWDVEGSHDDTCIEIRNAEAHFLIRECKVHDSELGYGESGIRLIACSNGAIEDCESFNNDEGVYLEDCVGISIRGTYCHSNSRGISLALSERCLIEDNDCSDGNYYGIYIEDGSSNNSCVGNECTDNENTGISIGNSWNDTLTGNICQYNGCGLELNGRNSSCNVTGNWFELNYGEGVYIMISCNNTVSWNSISDNQGYGVRISSESSSNEIWNNTFVRNNGADDTYDVGHVQACDDGQDNMWDNGCGYGNYWSDWTTPDTEPDEIVDVPYDVDGSAGAQDDYPRVAPLVIPEFSSTVVIVLVILPMICLLAWRRRVNGL